MEYMPDKGKLHHAPLNFKQLSTLEQPKIRESLLHKLKESLDQNVID